MASGWEEASNEQLIEVYARLVAGCSMVVDGILNETTRQYVGGRAISNDERHKVTVAIREEILKRMAK